MRPELIYILQLNHIIIIHNNVHSSSILKNVHLSVKFGERLGAINVAYMLRHTTIRMYAPNVRQGAQSLNSPMAEATTVFI